MPFDLQSFVGTLTALSVASERLTELIKGSLVAIPFIPTGWLETKQMLPPVAGQPPKVNEAAEAGRQLFIHVLAGLAGWATAEIANSTGNLGDPFKGWLGNPLGIVLIGALVSGGSGFWNSFATYVTAAKDAK